MTSMASEAISCVISTLYNRTEGIGKLHDAQEVVDEAQGVHFQRTFMIALTLMIYTRVWTKKKTIFLPHGIEELPPTNCKGKDVQQIPKSNAKGYKMR